MKRNGVLGYRKNIYIFILAVGAVVQNYVENLNIVIKANMSRSTLDCGIMCVILPYFIYGHVINSIQQKIMWKIRSHVERGFRCMPGKIKL